MGGVRIFIIPWIVFVPRARALAASRDEALYSPRDLVAQNNAVDKSTLVPGRGRKECNHFPRRALRIVANIAGIMDVVQCIAIVLSAASGLILSLAN